MGFSVKDIIFRVEVKRQDSIFYLESYISVQTLVIRL